MRSASEIAALAVPVTLASLLGTPEESAGPPPVTLTSLPMDLQRSILGHVSRLSRGYSHALVCRDWAALAPDAQESCACTCPEGDEEGAAGEEETEVEGEAAGEEGAAGSVELSRLAQELAQYPNLTSVDIANGDSLPPSVLSAIPDSVRHLSVGRDMHGICIEHCDDPGLPFKGLPRLPFEGLPRLRHLETLCVLSHVLLSETSWPLSASLQVLDLGGHGKMASFPRHPCGVHRVRHREHCRGHAQVAEGRLLDHISELRELRVFRANMDIEVTALPESMSQLTKLEELSLWAVGLESLFSHIGECRRLKRILISTWGCLILPPSFTQLSSLEYMYLSAEFGVRAPPGMGALTSLRTLEMSPTWATDVFEADTLLPVPSLRQLQTTGLPADMSPLTSLQKLTLSWNPSQTYPESMWALRSLRVLTLEEVRLEAIPESIRGLSCLEELEIVECSYLQGLPDSLAELPHLKKLVLEDIPGLRSLPPSIGSRPSLQTLHLKDLPQLRLSNSVFKQLRGLKAFQIVRCRYLRCTERRRPRPGPGH